MLKNLEEVGCKVDKKHFQCMPCDNTRSGGFSPEHGILLCQNRFFSKAHQEDTMVHEMIHMYDHCRFKVDWNNCKHHACSEVCFPFLFIMSASLIVDLIFNCDMNYYYYYIIKGSSG